MYFEYEPKVTVDKTWEAVRNQSDDTNRKTEAGQRSACASQERKSALCWRGCLVNWGVNFVVGKCLSVSGMLCNNTLG